MRETPWSEGRLEALTPYEHDTQEFKSSLFVHDGQGGVRSDFADKLSKQVSAFANAGGGQLFLGVDDAACVDGGVPTRLRANGTREWLEDVIPAVVEPPLRCFNVHEILPEPGRQSAIAPGRAVYVIDIPESSDAPHQARDRRYYLRIAGKSRPMAHRTVLDILQRQHDPEVGVSAVDPYGEPERIGSDPRGPSVLICLRATLDNHGRTLAKHVGCEFTLPRFAVNTECRQRTLREHAGTLQQRPGEVTFFFYHPMPIFPQQQVPFGTVWIAIHRTNLHHYASGRVVFRWRVFADAASPREGSLDVAAFSVVKRGLRMVEHSQRLARRAE